MKVKGIIFPTLEKILVDLFCEEKLFFAYQGQQLVKIYEACLDKYSINFSRLFNYAKRRKRDEALKSFLMANNRLHEKIKEIIEWLVLSHTEQNGCFRTGQGKGLNKLILLW